MPQKNKRPEISVIVTSYNNADFLPKCLDALLTQSFENIEIICVDDASTDDTPNIIEAYGQKDPRIVKIINPKNVGVSEARNMAIERASAPYIMFCDGDDYYDPQMCKKMLDKMQHAHPRVDMVISEIRVIYNAHQEMKISDENYYNLHFSGIQTVNDQVLTETDFAPTNKLFKKELIEKYQLRFPKGLHYEDAYFCAAYMCICRAIYYLNEQLYTYVRHEGSIMSNTWSKEGSRDISIDHIYIAFQLFDFLERNNLLQKYNASFWRLFIAYERLSMNYSRSRQNTKKIRGEVRRFISEHKSKFDEAPAQIQAQILQLISQRLAPSKTKMKHMLLKFLPTYKLQIQNVTRLQALDQKNRQLLHTIRRLSSDEK